MVALSRFKVFIDIGGFIALIHRKDPKHDMAVHFYRSAGEKFQLFTSNMVISETYTWLRYHTSHFFAIKFLDILDGVGTIFLSTTSFYHAFSKSYHQWIGSLFNPYIFLPKS